MNTGFTIFFVDGGFTNFPGGAEEADEVVSWYQQSDDTSNLELQAESGKQVHTQKRHITRIVVE